MPDKIVKNQDTIQALWHAENPIEILFEQIKTGHQFVIAVNYPFTNRQIIDVVISQIIAKQEYTYAYCMWKSILADERTCMGFKTYFQEAYLN